MDPPRSGGHKHDGDLRDRVSRRFFPLRETPGGFGCRVSLFSESCRVGVYRRASSGRGFLFGRAP